MPDVPCLSVDEGIYKNQGITVLVRCVKPNSPGWEGPEDNALY